MKLLRLLAWLILIGASINAIVLLNLTIYTSAWYGVLAAIQLFLCYGLSEITHGLWYKPKPPFPTSLAFEKEITERYEL